MEVEAHEPDNDALRLTLENMRARGIKALFGRWLIEGSPRVLLFDTGSAYSNLDEWKGDLWNLAGIPTPPNDHETNETIVFGYLVAWFLGEACFIFSLSYFVLNFSAFLNFSLSLIISLNPSLPISTSGKLASPSLCAGRGTSM